MRVRDIINRYRHRHGYGVHSPYAFAVITQVMRTGGYRYYHSDKVEAAAGSATDARKYIILYNLAVSVDARSYYTARQKADLFDLTLKGVHSTMRKVHAPEAADVAVMTGCLPDRLPHKLAVLYNLTSAQIEEAVDMLPKGLALCTRGGVYLFPRSGMGKRVYII